MVLPLCIHDTFIFCSNVITIAEAAAIDAEGLSVKMRHDTSGFLSRLSGDEPSFLDAMSGLIEDHQMSIWHVLLICSSISSVRWPSGLQWIGQTS
jgi:hypothetical protein